MIVRLRVRIQLPAPWLQASYNGKFVNIEEGEVHEANVIKNYDLNLRMFLIR